MTDWPRATRSIPELIFALYGSEDMVKISRSSKSHVRYIKDRLIL